VATWYAAGMLSGMESWPKMLYTLEVAALNVAAALARPTGAEASAGMDEADDVIEECCKALDCLLLGGEGADAVDRGEFTRNPAVACDVSDRLRVVIRAHKQPVDLITNISRHFLTECLRLQGVYTPATIC
jgi:hypothetical protein